MSYHHRFPGSGSGSGSSSSSGFHFLNSPFGDTTYTKVFVGGLAWETKNDTLGRYFEQFGEILEAVVITDKNTGRSKGYGFVTFRDSDSAQRACADPSPVIDGRRANCNLASLRRTWPSPLHAQMRPASPFIGGPPTPRGAYLGGSTYPQPVPYNYQQGFLYPPYGFMSYGPDYAYQQNAFTPFPGQQFVPIYGISGIPSPSVYPYGQLGQHLSTGQGYTSQPYATPGHQFMQFTGPSFTGAASAPMSILPPPYPTGMPTQRAASPLYVIPSQSPKFTQGSNSEQNIG